MKMRPWSLFMPAIAAILLFQASCNLVSKTIATGGEERLTEVAPPPTKIGPHVIIFALDGAVPSKLMDAVDSGQAPHIAAILGEDKGNGLFAHAYVAPHALSVLPSSTIADWASVFTGAPPAYDGVTGDEWFDRGTMTFLAPVPVSTPDTTDNTKTVSDDLVGKAIKVPTLYEDLGVRSYVALQQVHRGATLYTTVSPGSFTDLISHLIKGELRGEDPKKSLSAAIDRDTAKKLIEAIEEHGIPDLQVVYQPGIDIFTHAAKDPLNSQEQYLEQVTDGVVGAVLDEYRKKSVLDNTYVIFISDHSHIPTINDDAHRLGTDDEHSPFAVVASAGFRVRRPFIINPKDDYQAVLAYQGSMAYIYLADRSTCPSQRQRCDWKKAPRFRDDVIPVLRAFYRSDRWGHPERKLKGTLDLIFARPPMPPGQKTLPYEIFDGRNLVSINDYLMDNPRPDLPDLAQRMEWLSAGPYGDRAGDILLLPKACMDISIQARYYFSDVTHYSWHGSACEQDSHIPFILGQVGGSGVKMRSTLRKFGGASASEKELTPLVRYLFEK
jgi:Type I phosphodiesterase / nucleotide pyrophosphatase